MSLVNNPSKLNPFRGKSPVSVSKSKMLVMSETLIFSTGLGFYEQTISKLLFGLPLPAINL